MAASSSASADHEPLLHRFHSPTDSISEFRNDDEVSLGGGNHLGRTMENDVLPEMAVLGRNLGCSSAYLLILSRVIGSGILATAGAEEYVTNQSFSHLGDQSQKRCKCQSSRRLIVVNVPLEATWWVRPGRG